MKGIHEKQLFFLASDRGGAKKKNLREKIERRKEEKKKEKSATLSIRTFTPPFQNVRTCEKDFAISKSLSPSPHAEEVCLSSITGLT